MEEPPSATVAPGGSPALHDTHAKTSTRVTVNSSYREKFAAATDYRAFVSSVLGAAQSGDKDAQYSLYEALFYCDDKFSYYFTRGKRHLTLDEALQWTSSRAPAAMDDVRTAYSRCHELQESPLDGVGSASEWLKLATAAGNPLAQARTAEIDLMQSSLATYRAYQGETPKTNPDEQRRTAIDLVNQALKSKDPEVLWAIGDMSGLITGSTRNTDTDQWAWKLAACNRGFDCSETAPWRQASCHFDAGTTCISAESGVDMIRRFTGDSFTDVEKSAKEINSLLDTNAWDKLSEMLVGSANKGTH